MKHPEKYGVSVIDAGPDADFSPASNYTVSSGLAYSEAVGLCKINWERIAREYKSQKFFKLNLEELLLYLSHCDDQIFFFQAIRIWHAQIQSFLPKLCQRNFFHFY